MEHSQAEKDDQGLRRPSLWLEEAEHARQDQIVVALLLEVVQHSRPLPKAHEPKITALPTMLLSPDSSQPPYRHHEAG
jgi:hypothetical protein